MNINLICTDGDKTIAWHINPTECSFLIGLDGSITIKPTDSAWEQHIWGLEDVNPDQQIDPTQEPWPEILRIAAERTEAGQQARKAAAQQNAAAKMPHA